jgi:RHS repeat-associated protein
VGNRYYFTGSRLTLYEDHTLSGISPNRQIQFNRARHYDPEAGRWLQRDEAEYGDSMNLYEYVTSRILVLVDPGGRQSQLAQQPPQPVIPGRPSSKPAEKVQTCRVQIRMGHEGEIVPLDPKQAYSAMSRRR